MKAAQITEYGDASTVKINDVPKPEAGEGKVLVEVHASSINPFDITVRSGGVQQRMPLQFPATLGGDFAGVVEAVGEGVTGLAKGDRVYGQAAAIAGNSGAFAEFAITSAEQVAKMPASLDFNQAASLPLVGSSAVQALTEHLNLQPGQKILITGGTGGIGSLAVQIAKHIGAAVTATADKDGLDMARQLGADEVINYETQDITELGRVFDAVFDTTGALFDKSLQTLKPGGVGVTMIAQINEELASKLQVKALMQGTKVNTEHLDKLRQLVEAGVIKPQVDRVFGLDQIADAFRAKEGGGVKGKIVIAIR